MRILQHKQEREVTDLAQMALESALTAAIANAEVLGYTNIAGHLLLWKSEAIRERKRVDWLERTEGPNQPEPESV